MLDKEFIVTPYFLFGIKVLMIYIYHIFSITLISSIGTFIFMGTLVNAIAEEFVLFVSIHLNRVSELKPKVYFRFVRRSSVMYNYCGLRWLPKAPIQARLDI